MTWTTLLAILAAPAVVVLVVVIARLYREVMRLNTAFGKLGYLAREDVKQYFDQAAQHAAELYAQTAAQNQANIDNSLKRVLAESTTIMKGTIAAAEKESAAIIAKAHQDAAVIIEDGRRDAEKYRGQLIDYSADAIEWAMSEYMKMEFKLGEHEALITKLIGLYLDEHHGL